MRILHRFQHSVPLAFELAGEVNAYPACAKLSRVCLRRWSCFVFHRPQNTPIPQRAKAFLHIWKNQFDTSAGGCFYPVVSNTNNMTMTTSTPSREQTRKILQAIEECDAFIAKESPRNANSRPAGIQKTLDFYIAHRAKLAAMI